MKLFKHKNSKKLQQMPVWEEVVETMYGKDLNNTEGYKIINVIYSSDKEHRFIILESDDNYFTYSFESLYPYDEAVLKYITDNLFAYWQPENYGAKPIFDDMEILMRELKTAPEYRSFFENK